MRRLVPVVLATLALGTACTVGEARPETDQQRIGRYFTELNQAGGRGDDAQLEFLRRTQHPDFADQMCDLRGVTLHAYPALSTVRPDPAWAPEGAEPPRGRVYVVAVSLTLRRGGAMLGEQIGSERVAVLRGQVYGFAPCLSGG